MTKYIVCKTTVENRSSRDNSPLEIHSETIRSFVNEEDAKAFLSTVELPEPHHDDIDVYKEIIEIDEEDEDQYRADPDIITLGIGDEIRFTVDDHPVIAKILGFETNGVRVRDEKNEIKSYLVGAERIEAVFPKFK